MIMSHPFHLPLLSRNNKSRVRTAMLTMVLASTVLVIGCAGAVRPTGFLDDYESFDEPNRKSLGVRLLQDEPRELDRFFPHTDEIHRAERRGESLPSPEDEGYDPEEIQPVVFVIPRPQWQAEGRLNEPEDEERVAFIVRERLYRYLLREYPHPVRVRYAWSGEERQLEGYRVLEVRTAITDVKRGSGWVRYVIGYGAGAAVLQLEGQIVDVTPDKEETLVAEFALRSAHAAYPQGFFNPRVMSDKYALMYAAEAGTRKLVPRLRESIPAARLRPDNGSYAAADGADR